MFADPLATDVLESLPEKHLEEALWGCLQYVIGHASNAEPVIACCQRLSRHVELHAADIALIRILQGRFDDAEAVFNELPPAVRESRLAQTGLASTRGLIALLRGDDLEARREIDAALAAEKAGSRKTCSSNIIPVHSPTDSNG